MESIWTLNARIFPEDLYVLYETFFNFINAVTRHDLVIPSIGKIANQSEIVRRNYKHLQQTYI